MSDDRGRYLAGRTTCASSAGSDGDRARAAASDCCRQRAGVSRTGPGGLERRTRGAAGVHTARQAGTKCLHRKLQRTTARRMPERELVHQLKRRTAKDRSLAAGLQRTTPTQLVELLAARTVCTDRNGDAGMRKASTRLPEQGTQTPSPAPDLIPAETKNQPRTHIAIGTANGGTSPPLAPNPPKPISAPPKPMPTSPVPPSQVATVVPKALARERQTLQPREVNELSRQHGLGVGWQPGSLYRVGRNVFGKRCLIQFDTTGAQMARHGSW
jgi:hypothetical protein